MDLFMIVQDGKPIKRGLSRSQAERHAAYLADGYLSHRANDKRRIAEFNIKPDVGLLKELDENWKALKRGE